jgi:hypothetical protein
VQWRPCQIQYLAGRPNRAYGRFGRPGSYRARSQFPTTAATASTSGSPSPVEVSRANDWEAVPTVQRHTLGTACAPLNVKPADC